MGWKRGRGGKHNHQSIGTTATENARGIARINNLLLIN